MRLTQRDDAGVATIIVVFFAVILLAAVGISVDVSRAVAVSRSAQNSADAVALAMGKDCVRRGDLTAIEFYDGLIREDPAIGNGQIQNHTAGSCADGFVGVTATAKEAMDYTFSKVFGVDDTLQARSATAKWSQLASGTIFPFAFSNCAFPDPGTFTAGDSVTPGTPLMLYGHGVRTSCVRDGDTTGQGASSKGFVEDGCVHTAIDGKLTDANGNSLEGTECESSSLNFYVGKDVLLPVWGSSVPNGAGPGGGSDYTIKSLVGFHVLGWSIQGNGPAKRGGAMSARCTSDPILPEYPAGFTGHPETTGDDQMPCLYGYVTSFTSTEGGTTGEPCTGPTTDSLQPACFVYLSH